MYILRHSIVIGIGILTALFLGTVPVSAGARQTLVDQTGREIRLPKFPQRIVALAPSITEVIYALDCEDRLKGATRFSDYPEAAKGVPKVGSYVYLDLEKIVALDPDVCIAIKDGNPKTVVDRLESLGIPVFAVNPRGLASVMRTITDIGRLMGVEERAERIVSDMKSRIEKVESKVARADKRPRVFFQIGISPIVSAGSDTFIHELIVKAGGRNIAGKYQSYPKFSREEVLELAPEVLIITSMARDEVFERVKAEWEKWHQIPAVAGDRVHLVDSNLYDRPSPRLVDALEELLGLIHPEL
ncbi:MAG: cobalamin-binding protein [Desulfobacterales bacterium]|nr:cobalamin-binding protein [Desulfobacterales bacterium]